MWDNFALLVPTFERDDVVQIRGRVKLYNGQKELALEQIIPALERDYDLSDFLPHTKYDVEKMYAELRAAVAGSRKIHGCSACCRALSMIPRSRRASNAPPRP